MTAESAPAPAARPARPTPLLAGVALTVAEGSALVVWGGYIIVAALVESTRNQGLAEYGGVVILLLGLLPLVAARGLLKLRRWGRTPAVLIHTLALPVAWFMWGAGDVMAGLGALVGVAGLAGLVLLLNPKVTAALYQPES
ncbi:hypothetical protein [Kitasatospora viridis]|uniref:Integral membrane protein n=1 Tax=Kitasatospora viridis TaxID=281105 RepID=A0A561UF17_9ACTN|nr:hypothetical protein [Kitasatospora viridis]TWF97962.1 hypothetical protein FHX73_111764 [Kitasatospora viridis]